MSEPHAQNITLTDLYLCFDMAGCPNSCRHCWLGQQPRAKVSESQVREISAEFRQWLSHVSDQSQGCRSLKVSTSIFEPDFAPNYRDLYALEDELSDGPPLRYELLSVWRLARDEQYAQWARTVGPQRCQISFSGLEETNDWFFQRPGAFHDNLMATERLLSVGMRPRWQLFLTRKILDEIQELYSLIKDINLPDRVRQLGWDFEVFMNLPDPVGAGIEIEYLRPNIEELEDRIPLELLAASRKHFNKDQLWDTEGELCRSILESSIPLEVFPKLPKQIYLFVNGELDVFPNLGSMTPAWRLGSLKTQSAQEILESLYNGLPLAFQVRRKVPAKRVVEAFGDLDSRRVYTDCENILDLYYERWCESKCSCDLATE